MTRDAGGAPGAEALRWTVVVPVKRAGKSRLDVPGDRIALARAIALDTIAAATACELVDQVIVVTDDGALPLHAVGIPGLRFVPENDPPASDAPQPPDAPRSPPPPPPPPDAPALGTAAATPPGAPAGSPPPGEVPSRLDAAIARGIAAVPDRMPRAALLGDLPALRPGDLADALRLASAHARAVVADADGTGSTLVTAGPGVPWTSAFGAGSFARHVALGCTPLEVPDASSIRHDVDTAAQLDAAASLGLGPRTTALLDRA